MRGGKRALVEVTAWLVQHFEKFFQLVPAMHEFGGDQHGMRKPLELLDGRKIDPTYVWSDCYDLRIFPDVMSTQPKGLLPPDYDWDKTTVKYTFAIWTQHRPLDSIPIGCNSALEGNVKTMWQHILPDMHALGTPNGVARQRLALLGEELEKRIPGYSFLHLATVESARNPPLEYANDLVSVFVDLDTLERVAGRIES